MTILTAYATVHGRRRLGVEATRNATGLMGQAPSENRMPHGTCHGHGMLGLGNGRIEKNPVVAQLHGQRCITGSPDTGINQQRQIGQQLAALGAGREATGLQTLTATGALESQLATQIALEQARLDEERKKRGAALVGAGIESIGGLLGSVGGM